MSLGEGLETAREPSEMFRRALEVTSHVGGCHITCELCGREHFTSNGGFDFDEGELEGLLLKSEAMPGQYIDHGEVTVTWGYVHGKQAVVDCPCNKLRHVEDWIVRHREVIVEYLIRRAEELQKISTAELSLANKVRNAQRVENAAGKPEG